MLEKLWKPVSFLLYTMEQRTGSWMKPVFELLEMFQAKIGCRIFKLSTFHSQLSVHIGLSWPSISSRILKQKRWLFPKRNREVYLKYAEMEEGGRRDGGKKRQLTRL